MIKRLKMNELRGYRYRIYPDAEQSVQIADLAKTTEKQGERQDRLLNRLVMAIIGVLLILVLALVFGALGEHGFNGVIKAVPFITNDVAK